MINDKCQIINDNSLVKLIMLPTVLLELHFNVLYCIKRLMQCNVQMEFFIFPALYILQSLSDL